MFKTKMRLNNIVATLLSVASIPLPLSFALFGSTLSAFLDGVVSMSEAKYYCPVEVTLEVIGGKWKCVILWWLRRDVKRFGELRQLIPGITQKILTQQLRELEEDGLIRREAYREAPPRVEYSLTPSGETVRPITELMCEWGKAHKPEYKFGSLRLEGLQILIVEDKADIREQLRTMLEECQAQAFTVASASEALDMLSRAQPDALVIDTGMPNNEGYALIRQLRALEAERGERIPAVALTAYASASERRQALREGFQVHLAKPVEPAELVAALAMLTRPFREQRRIVPGDA